VWDGHSGPSALSLILILNLILMSEFECHGEILELKPPRLLEYSWIANWHDD